jgi:peptidoglycan/LPS O-acetylase OafA/YrhL
MDLNQFAEVWAVMCLALTIGAGLVVYRLVEFPITNRLQKWWTVSQRQKIPTNKKLVM